VRVLITGGAGFLGSFTAQRRLADGDQVWSTRFEGAGGNQNQTPGVKTIACDVTVPEELEQAIDESEPDLIFHFAAQTFIGESWADPKRTLITNCLGTVNLLEILRTKCSQATVVIACSSAEYGEVAGRGAPVQETDPLRPVSPYGLSKLDQDILGYLYFRTHGLRVIRARIFNTIGPGKRGDFLADFCQQITVIEAGKAEPFLRTGELNSRRDLTDVRDTVAALDLLAKRGAAGEAYNVCSGQTIRIGDVVTLLMAVAGRQIKIQVEGSRLRPFEESVIWGDNKKLIARTGWSPQISLGQTVKDTLDYWRERAADGGLRTDRILNAAMVEESRTKSGEQIVGPAQS
jgi:GDP-4-dehydro-6-deoxy-D-mannose reductase